MTAPTPQVQTALSLLPFPGLVVEGGRVLLCNEFAVTLLGREATAPGAELATSGLDADWATATDGAVVTQRTRRDGRPFVVEVRPRQIDMDGRHVTLLCLQDVSETEEQLTRLQGAVDAARLGVFDHDQGHPEQPLWCSPRLREQYGLSADEPVSLARFTERFPAQPELQAAIARAHDPTGDGHFDAEFRIEGPGGGEVWLHSRAQTYFGLVDGRPAPVRTVGATVNITARKQLEAQFRHAQKMEAVGRLAAGVAHDFNNLLSVILGSATLASEDLDEGHPIRGELTEILRAADRASDLTRQLLAFGRKSILAPKVIDVGELLTSMRKLIDRVVGEAIELSLHTAPTAGPVKADGNVLEQVILNLVINARDAMPTGGQLTVETQPFFADEAYVEAHPSMLPGHHVAIAVSDTGSGMDEATKARIFEPFFTTKAAGRGTGLGLAMVHGIIEQSGGHIWVYSEEGRGTTFKVYLPCTSEVPLPEAPAPTPRSSQGGTVLVVEDEAQLRRVIVAILGRVGYTTLESGRPREALALAQEHPSRIDLLLTDVVMPQMTGRELAERLTEARPEMAVLYSSGYTENTIVHQGELEAGVHFLPKPVTPRALLHAVEKALGRA